MQLPKNVERNDLMQALDPLLALLGLDRTDVAADPPIVIDGDFITLTVLDPEADVRIPIVQSRPVELPFDAKTAVAGIQGQVDAIVSQMSRIGRQVEKGAERGTRFGMRKAGR